MSRWKLGFVTLLITAAAAHAEAQSLCADQFAFGEQGLAQLLRQQQKQLLDGEIVSHWPASQSSFGARYVKFADNSMGVWKADNAQYNTLRHEMAASLVDAHIGLFMVPATVVKDLGGIRGTVQWVVGPLNNKRFSEMTDELGFFDFLIDNRDRSRNNILQTESGMMVAIDHGLSFGEIGNWRSERAFENFKINISAIESLQKITQGLKADIANGDKTESTQTRYKTLRQQISNLESRVQVFAPEREVVQKLKATTEETWARLLGEHITPLELQNMVARQKSLIEAFDHAEKVLGTDRLYRNGGFSSTAGVVVKEAPAPAPGLKLQNMKNRRGMDF